MKEINTYIIEKLKVNKEVADSSENYLLLVTQEDNAIEILNAKYGDDYYSCLDADYLYYILPIDIAEKYIKWGSIYIYHIYPGYKKLDDIKTAIENNKLDWNKLKSY